MMCSAYFGELSEERKANWNHKEENPYSVLVSPISLERKGHRLLDVGNMSMIGYRLIGAVLHGNVIRKKL